MKCTSFWKGSGKEALVLWLGQAGMGLQVVLNQILEKRAFSTGRVLEAKVERVYARAGSAGTPVGPAWMLRCLSAWEGRESDGRSIQQAADGRCWKPLLACCP